MGWLLQIGVVQRDWRDDRIAELEGMVAKLMARVADLEEKLAISSRNSSKPPSSDPPTVTRNPKAPSGRKPGGQPGHKRHHRELFPPEKVRSVTECKPARCGECQHGLRGNDPEPHVIRSQSCRRSSPTSTSTGCTR